MGKASKIQMLIILLVAIFIAGSATAAMMNVPADPSTLVASLIGSSLGALGTVDSYVYQYDSGAYATKYLYTYKLTSTSMGISFFSVGVDVSANLTMSVAHYENDGGVSPLYWNPVGTPLQSVDAGFYITPLSSGQASALLWFISDAAPVMGDGFAFGASSKGQTFESGPLYTVPEPATIIMLTTGAIWGCARRRKHAA